MKGLRKTAAFAATVLLVCAALALAVHAENVSGKFFYGLTKTFNEDGSIKNNYVPTDDTSDAHFYKIVDSSWSLDTETGILTIVSNDTGYNETGSGGTQKISEKYGGWYKYRNLVKKVVLSGNFGKISNNAFSGHENLEEITITQGISQINAGAFKNCKNLRSVTIEGCVPVDGFADMRYIGSASNMPSEIFAGCVKLTKVRVGSGVQNISDTAFPSTVTEIWCEKGSAADAFAAEKGLSARYVPKTFLLTTVCDGGISRVTCSTGVKLNSADKYASGNALLYFKDSGFTELYDFSEYETEDLTLYAKKIIVFEGYSIRLEDYRGLRSVYRFREDAGEIEAGGYEVSSYGIITCRSDYVLDSFDENSAGAKKIEIMRDGVFIGKICEKFENGSIRFAATATGFEGGDEVMKATSTIVSKAYATIKNNTTGETFSVYTMASGSTLRKACERYFGQGLDKTETEAHNAFASRILSDTRGKGNYVRYSRDDLMTVMKNVYNDNDHVIMGMQAYKDFDDTLEYFKSGTASGKEMSIIGIDLADYGIQLESLTDLQKENYIKSLVKYAHEGGIVTASSHFDNPAGTGGFVPGTKGAMRGWLGFEDAWEELLTDGTVLNTKFREELDLDAEFLLMLKRNDVPVLWRPFHEFNGGWFWWSPTQTIYNYTVDENGIVTPGTQKAQKTLDSSYFIRLWQYVYDYYTDVYGLDNLLWVYSPNTGNDALSASCYPGDDYVDMAGYDIYGSAEATAVSSYNVMKKVAPEKLFAYTEYGVSSRVPNGGNEKTAKYAYDELISWRDRYGMKTAYILTWTTPWSFAYSDDSDEIISKDYFYSKNDIFELFKALEK